MSVEIFKEGVKELCSPEQLGYQLQAGWSLTQDETAPEEPNDDKPDDYEGDIEKLADSTGELSEKDRYLAIAKDLDIKVHHKWKLETLIKKVEEALDGD